MNDKSHVLISGTGRAEIIFLVRLLNELGFHTGENFYFKNFCTVLKLDLHAENARFYFKIPHLCELLSI